MNCRRPDERRNKPTKQTFCRFDCGKCPQRDLFCLGNVGKPRPLSFIYFPCSVITVVYFLVNVDVFCVPTLSTLEVVIFQTIKLDS